jgi:ferredoxin
MPHHFTKNTVEASFWCAKCHGVTLHNVHCGRRGACQVCLKKLDDEKAARKPAEPAATQEELFK